MRGFTLIELLVTMAVAAILLGIAVPSYFQLMESNRVSADANRLLSTLNLARSEAIKRNQPVVVCVADASDPQCAAAGTDWDAGVLIFADANGNDALDAGEAIISLDRPFSSASSITGNTNVARRVTFSPGGRVTTIGTLSVLSPGGSHERRVLISRSGRSRIES